MLAEGFLGCVGRSTVSGMIAATGQQFKDWSAAYRLFHGERMNTDTLFSVVRKNLADAISADEREIYAHMDDTLLRKTGKKVDGAKWMRDPLGPPFQTNLVWGQRFMQTSLSLCSKMENIQATTVPVDLHHCPSVKKPKKDATEQDYEHYRETQKKTKLSVVGAQRISALRKGLDLDGHSDKRLVVSVDGSYTNEAVLKKLDKNVTLIGRIRKDCRLFELPDCSETNEKGRKRVYGRELPTPEQIRQSQEYEWKEVKAWAAGKVHTFNVKTVETVRWRKSGPLNLRLVVVRPVGYRLTKKSRMLYRNPAYLICTSTELSLEKLLQAYLWRWGIEVNFRDQKTLMGCGQAQVRKEIPCSKVPQFITAVNAMLLLSASKAEIKDLPRPKWYTKKKNQRTTTQDLINQFRTINWTDSVQINFSDFVTMENKQRSTKNNPIHALSNLFYTRN
uniref:IS701 family transposase n=1 Tax=Cyclobacterium salsum TaxID=2666329 RepID=UPI001F18FF4A|nr:transposase [Cyclobacterium salsum]